MADASNIKDKKDIFVESLKKSYTQLYNSIQPIPYIKDKLYCVDKIFIEGGTKFYSIKESTEGQGKWERVSSYKDIFTDPRIDAKRRIIKADAGYGKSTVTLQLAYDWCNDVKDSPFKDVEILILLRLRQLRSGISIYKAIKLLLVPNEPRVKSTDIKHIIESCDSCEIVLDGYDEYPDLDQIDKTDIGRIIKCSMLDSFPTCLTTRFLPKYYDKSKTKRLKLTGFDDKARKEYIRKAVTGDDEDAVEKIELALKDNPVLDDLCEVPLFFVMFAHITHENKDFRNYKSVTEFFGYMLECFRAHLKNKNLNEQGNEYNTAYETDARKLNEVAFSGLTSGLSWNKKDLCGMIGKGLYHYYQAIGILKEDVIYREDNNCEEKYETVVETSFYHKLFCEYFASLYISGVIASESVSGGKAILDKLDPEDLQHVFRFSCGLNIEAGRKIIKYLSQKETCRNLTILCILEQPGEFNTLLGIVQQLCSKPLEIHGDLSRSLQRAVVHLLQNASECNIPISELSLNWSFEKIMDGKIRLKSNVCLDPLRSLQTLKISMGNEDLSEGDVIEFIKFCQNSRNFKELWFISCKLPMRFDPEALKILTAGKTDVLWTSYARRLNSTTGGWVEIVKKETVAKMCTDVIYINGEDNPEFQQSAIDLVTRASSYKLPIYSMCLKQSFKSVVDGNIVLQSGLKISPLKSLEVLSISQAGARISEEQMYRLIEYVKRSTKFKECQFYFCYLPFAIYHKGGLFNKSSLKVKWYPFGYGKVLFRLKSKEGQWMKENEEILNKEEYEDLELDFLESYETQDT